MDETPGQPPATPAPAAVPAQVGVPRGPLHFSTWQDTVDHVRQYVVRISTPNGHGTGFLFAQSAKLWGIATAAHVVRDEHAWEQPIRIEHLESRNEIFLHHDKRAIFISNKADAAAIVLGKDGTIPFPATLLPLIDPQMFQNVGSEIGWLGYPGLGRITDQMCFFSGRISAWLGDASQYLLDGVAISGVSGSPAFTRTEGEILGIVTSYIPNLVRGQTLPGLASACDVAELQEVVQRFERLNQAQAQQTRPASSATPQQGSSGGTGDKSSNHQP